MQNIPKNTLIVVTDGGGARVLRNVGEQDALSLIQESKIEPADLLNEGPSGHRPSESTDQETDEATFAKQLAKHLYQLAHRGDYEHLILIADPQTLGQMRPLLHKEVTQRMLCEINKNLTKSTLKDIESALHKG